MPLADQALLLCQQAEQQRLAGDQQAAQALVQEALSLEPDRPEALAVLGLLLKSQGKLQEAVEAFKRALDAQPLFTAALYNLGQCWRALGESTAAKLCYEQVVEIEPNHGLALSCLGQLEHEAGALNQALVLYERAAALRSGDPVVHNNRAMALQEAGHLEEALEAYGLALELEPNYADACSNRAGALLEQGDLPAAIAGYRRAIALNPTHASAHNNLGMALLEAGEADEGWRYYEWRFRSNPNLIQPLSGPRWQGDAPSAAELVLVEEQGLGDTLQFIRYAPLLRSRFQRVSFCGGPKLAGLLRRSGLLDAVYSPEDLREGHRSNYQWLPLLSAPGLLGVHRDNPVLRQPYLQAEPGAVASWRKRLRQPGERLIGVNWQGNPSHERTNSRGRSMPLECLAALATLADVRLVSLQKGDGAEQLQGCSFLDSFVSPELQEAVDQAWDFEETAAVIAATDLVITTDTSAAHLAAALGHPTWVLLKAFPEWRWGRSGDQCSWYPSARLFRQSQPDDWSSVLQRLLKSLA